MVSGKPGRVRYATLSLRLKPELKRRIVRVCKNAHGPYKVTITALCEHGIELALKEMEQRNG